MKRIPNSSAVNGAFRGVRGEIRNALKGVNRVAAKAMAKGDYASAEAMAARGREVRAFAEQVEELRKRWRVLVRGGAVAKNGVQAERTPLWKYYQPILRALRDAGGEARLSELEPLVEKALADKLTASDREKMSRGNERWRVMVRRARKYVVAEGWIQNRTGHTWRITAAGRAVAEREQFREQP